MIIDVTLEHSVYVCHKDATKLLISAHHSCCGIFSTAMLRINVKHGLITTGTGETIRKEELSKCIDQQWTDSLFEIARILQRVTLSTAETIILIAILIFSPGKIIHFHTIIFIVIGV